MGKVHGMKTAAVVAVTTAVCLGPGLGASAATSLRAIHDPGRVTYSVKLVACHARDAGKLPDPSCTPGSIDPAIGQQDTCHPGALRAKSAPPVRQFEWARFRVAYPAYHVSAHAADKLDYLVPLELGGSNDITNLWPLSDRDADRKDAIERQLGEAVCDGLVTLPAVQVAIATNWQTAKDRLGLPADIPSPRHHGRR